MHLRRQKDFTIWERKRCRLEPILFSFLPEIPGGSRAKALDEADVARFLAYGQEQGIKRILAHAPYTLNPCSKDEHTREFALETMEDDLRRMEYVPGSCYNFHPGSHVGQGAETGIRMIADTLNRILELEDWHTTLLLETMAGREPRWGGGLRNWRPSGRGWRERKKWGSAWIPAMYTTGDTILWRP